MRAPVAKYARTFFSLWLLTSPLQSATTIQHPYTSLYHTSTCAYEIIEESKREDTNLPEVEREGILNALRMRKGYETLEGVDAFDSGGESIVLRLRFREGPGHHKVLLLPKNRRRGLRSLAAARAISRRVHRSELDTEGAQYLLHYVDFPQLVTCGQTERRGLVCDLASNGTLGDMFTRDEIRYRFLDGSARSFLNLLRLWRHVALGVRALHRHGYVHGDIKPSNILLTLKYDGTKGTYREAAILADLGLSGREGRWPKGIARGWCFGTREYLDGARLFGGPLTHQSDLHALRLLYVEMLLGIRLRSLIRHGLPVRNALELIPADRRHRIPWPVLWVINEAHAPSLNQPLRNPTIEDLIHRIDAAQESLSTVF